MGYKGTHEIDFSVDDQSPIVLFLGENGHGKTTIQHACKWCLYEETQEKNEKIPVLDLVNRKALNENRDWPNFEMSVELEWQESGRTYNLKRRFQPFAQGIPAPRARLRIDGENPVPASAIPDYVQRFLAREISHFFFFDGETQDEFDKMTSNHNSAAFIRSEIEKSLSIPVISDGIAWLKYCQSEESAALIKANVHNEKMRKAGLELEGERKRLVLVQQELASQKQKLKDANTRIQMLEAEVANIDEAQVIQSEISALKSRVNTLREKRNEKLAFIRENLADNFWLPVSGKLEEIRRNLVEEVSQAEEIEQENQILKSRVSLLEQFINHKTCPLCGSQHAGDASSVLQEIKSLKDRINEPESKEIGDLRLKLKSFENFSFRHGAYVEARNLQKEFDADGADLSVASQKLIDKQNQMALFGNADIVNLVTSMKSLVSDAESARNNIDQYELDESEIEKKISRLESAVGKGVSPQKRIAHNAFSYLVRLFELAKEDYVTLVRHQVESYASETFLSIISDKKYTGLRINENFGVDLILPDGKIDPLRSTGQGKVSTISLVSGLIKTAMDEGFILMDTPFVSLDLGHREAVCRWASSSGFRVSLFMHSGEFVWERDRSAFGDSIGRVYRIRKLDADESTIEMELT
jgi:DNA sulfur modification protein DndD